MDGPEQVALQRARLAPYVRQAREDLAMTQAQAAHAGGMSLRTWSQIEAPPPRAGRLTMRTTSQVETVLGWTQGSVRRILAGGEPAVDPAPRIVAQRTPAGPPLTADQIAAITWRISRSLDDIVAASVEQVLRPVPADAA